MNRSRYKLRLVSILSAVAINLVAGRAFAVDGNAPTWQKDKPYYITILHTNDHHGHFWQNDIGEYGLSAQKMVVDNIRKEVDAKGGSVLLLSGGDINTGVPESDIQQAEPDFKGMSMIGYDAMAVGNHEFDHPLATIREQQAWSEFPFLSANIYFANSDKRVFSPYKIFNKNGIKIAVFGLTTEDTIIQASPINTKGIDFRKTVPEAKKIINTIQSNEQPDITIAVTHMGHYPNGAHGSMAKGDVTLARSLNTGDLDMIVGGHSQNPVCMAKSNVRIENYVPGTPCAPDQQNGTWIVQAHEWGKYVGRADFKFLNGKLTLENYQLIPINLKREADAGNDVKRLEYYTQEIKQDDDLKAMLTPYQEQGQEKLSATIGRLHGSLTGDRSIVRHQQSNMGQMILQALIERTQADFAIITGGMIRDSMIDGEISYRDVLKVEPFGNTVSYFDLTGQQLMDYLAIAVQKTPGSGGYGHYRNLTITLNKNNKIVAVLVKQQPLDKNKQYRVATLNFLASGGDGYQNVTKLPSYVDTGYVDAEVLKQFIEDHSPIEAKEYEPHNIIVTP